MDATISKTAIIKKNVVIGENCIIGDNVVVFENVTIGDNTVIENNVTLGHPIGLYVRDENARESMPATIIGADSIIRTGSIIYCGTKLGSKARTGTHVAVREFCAVGDSSIIGTLVQVENNTIIGQRVSIETGAHITAKAVIEDDIFIGPHVVTTNDNQMLRPIDVANGKKAELKGPHIKKGVRIGANATILPGMMIGKNSVIAAGSIVTKDVPENSVMVGVPAKKVKDVGEEFWLG